MTLILDSYYLPNLLRILISHYSLLYKHGSTAKKINFSLTHFSDFRRLKSIYYNIIISFRTHEESPRPRAVVFTTRKNCIYNSRVDQSHATPLRWRSFSAPSRPPTVTYFLRQPRRQNRLIITAAHTSDARQTNPPRVCRSGERSFRKKQFIPKDVWEKHITQHRRHHHYYRRLSNPIVVYFADNHDWIAHIFPNSCSFFLSPLSHSPTLSLSLFITHALGFLVFRFFFSLHYYYYYYYFLLYCVHTYVVHTSRYIHITSYRLLPRYAYS